MPNTADEAYAELIAAADDHQRDTGDAMDDDSYHDMAESIAYGLPPAEKREFRAMVGF